MLFSLSNIIRNKTFVMLPRFSLLRTMTSIDFSPEDGMTVYNKTTLTLTWFAYYNTVRKGSKMVHKTHLFLYFTVF